MLTEEYIPNERLRRARHLKGWTQSDLALSVGTDFETVSRWERGITMPSAYFREHLCRVLEKTPEELGFVQSLDERDHSRMGANCLLYLVSRTYSTATNRNEYFFSKPCSGMLSTQCGHQPSNEFIYRQCTLPVSL